MEDDKIKRIVEQTINSIKTVTWENSHGSWENVKLIINNPNIELYVSVTTEILYELPTFIYHVKNQIDKELKFNDVLTLPKCKFVCQDKKYYLLLVDDPDSRRYFFKLYFTQQEMSHILEKLDIYIKNAGKKV